MSKQLWVDAYDEKHSELVLERDEGLNTFTDRQIDIQSTAWAEGALERAQDSADFMRKAERENG
tara:strand:- start:555 stop:746 length:192 start_codon:yes stop_codon:yes gene_type:complete